MAVEKSSTFKTKLHQYLFGNSGDSALLTEQPSLWGMSIHEAANNPVGASLNSTWFTDPLKRKSAVQIASWSAISADYANGVENTAEITFDYVPSGQSWAIAHYIIWAITGSVGSYTYHPIYAGTFASTINLTQLQILYIDAGNLTLTEQ